MNSPSLRETHHINYSPSNINLCPSCNNVIEAGESYCGNCGYALAVDKVLLNKISSKSVLPLTPKIICTKCGAELESGESFCGSCGQVVTVKTPEKTPPVIKSEIEDKPKPSKLPWKFAITASITLAIIGVIAYFILTPEPGNSIIPVNPSDNVSTPKPTSIKNQLFTGFKGQIYGLAFSSDGKMLVACSSQNTTPNQAYESDLRLYDLATGQVKQQITASNEGFISLAFSPNSRLIGIATGLMSNTGVRSGGVKLFDAQTGQVIGSLLAHTDFTTSITFSPYGTTFATGSWDGTIKVWDVSTGELLQTILAGAAVNTVAYSPDGRLLASGNQVMTVQLWDAVTGAMLTTLPSPNTGIGIKTVAFSPDGRTLATGSWSTTNDNQINLWDLQNLSLVHTFRDQGYGVHSIAFSPDGHRLVSGSWDDKNIQLWDVNTASLIRRFTGHNGGVRVVAFSPDGKLVASGSEDTTVRIWNINAQ